MIFDHEWQSPHTLKFFVIVNVVPGFVFKNPYVSAKRSLFKNK